LRAKVRVFVELYRKTIALRREMAERQRLEREAQRAQHFALLGRLAAGVSHEIRNPLSAIFLHVDVLEEELRQPSPESAAALTQALSEIKTQLARLGDLVQDYLSLARVATIERTPQDLGVAVQTWVQEWLLLAIPQEVRLQLAGMEHLGTVSFHSSTLRRALLNLVQNALDAMLQGGTLTLRGEGTATQVQLQVRDTGSGIPAEQLPHIFEPLYTTKPEGTGLGLYLTQEIVAAHGGKVMVESVVGQGTTFTLTLPRAVEQSTSEDRGDDDLSDAPGGT
jgi:signal transduction histidine kinase